MSVDVGEPTAVSSGRGVTVGRTACHGRVQSSVAGR